MLLSGEQVVLKTADYEAHIGSVGASLSKLTYKGQDIALSYDPDTVPLAHLHKVLIPWPNRIYKGEYTVHGKDCHLWINDFKGNCAIHGLCAFEFWDIAKCSETQVTFKHLVGAREAYPFILECQVVYTLSDQDGLSVNIQVKNLSKQSAPVGIGCHPYLTCNGQVIDECEVSGVKLVGLKYNSEFILEGEEPNPAANVFAQGFAKVGNIVIDNCFKLAEPTANPIWTFKLKSQQHKLVSALTSNTPYLQLFTAEKLHRTGFAVEPMTCGVNAFNQKDAALVLLEPNSTTTMDFRIYGELLV